MLLAFRRHWQLDLYRTNDHARHVTSDLYDFPFFHVADCTKHFHISMTESWIFFNGTAAELLPTCTAKLMAYIS